MTGTANIRNELSLLIRLCRLDFDPAQTEKIKSLISEVKEWQYFAGMANVHGVGAMAYYNLNRLGLLEFLPAETRDFLKNLMVLNLARNTSHISHVKEVLSILGGDGIKTVLLKGMALEHTVYGNRGIRQMTDVDVLISGDECINARKLLLDRGFRSLPLKSPVHKLIIAYTGKHLPSLLKGDFSVEIHHELFGGGGKSLTKMLYDGSSETEIEGEKAFIPDAQLHFLYLVRHLGYHEMNNESQLRLYADLALLIEKYPERILNTDLFSLAERAGIENILAGKLYLLREFWGITFPGWMNDHIYIRYTEAVTDKFLFFLESPKGNPVAGRDIPYKYIIKEIPGIHRKILFVLGDLFPSVQFMKRRYRCSSSWKALLYYPHRFGKLWYLVK